MKCHYIQDPEIGKVLIPGCMGTAAMGVHNCTCYDKIPYNNPYKEEVSELRKENVRLHRVIRNLIKRNLIKRDLRCKMIER